MEHTSFTCIYLFFLSSSNHTTWFFFIANFHQIKGEKDIKANKFADYARVSMAIYKYFRHSSKIGKEFGCLVYLGVHSGLL